MATKILDEKYVLSSEEREFLALWRLLDSSNKQRLVAFALSMLSNGRAA